MGPFEAVTAEGGRGVALAMADRVPSDRRASVRKVVDKNLFNFESLGLIHLILPDAPIIEVVRNPMDTIVSAYKHQFYEVQATGEGGGLKEPPPTRLRNKHT